MMWMSLFLMILVVYAALCVRIVSQQSICVVETFGKFSRTIDPGLNFIFVPFQLISGTVDLRIEEVKSDVSVKTKDNVFVDLPVSIQLRVDTEKVYEAFYKLSNPHKQVKTWVMNAIRSISSGMTLEEMFEDRNTIINDVSVSLKEKLSNYGFTLEAILIDQPSVSQEVQDSFNRVVAAKRLAEAAEQEGRAEKVMKVAVAEAEAEAQRQRAKGLADARMTLAMGIKDSMEMFTKNNVSASAALDLLTEANRIDALRDVGKHGNTILVDLRADNKIGVNVNPGATGSH